MKSIRRLPSGRGFRYCSHRGRPLTDERTLERIRSLAIPPAWTDLKICPSPRGHLQATGRDAKGRKQYRYHERWRTTRDETKFDWLIDFATALPRIRRRVERDLRLPGLPRDKILATVVRLLETTLIRVGNDEYARTNQSYGLTTLRNRHVHVRKAEIQFEFRGKSGVKHCVSVDDRRLARIVKRCKQIPGHNLFQYLDEDGKRHPIGSTEVNDYLRDAARGEYTAKDFRTWGATLLAARAFHVLPIAKTKGKRSRDIARAVQEVARQLGNTAAVCRKCYIHSAIIESYLDGSLPQALRLPKTSEMEHTGTKLTLEEVAVLDWLRKGKVTGT